MILGFRKEKLCEHSGTNETNISQVVDGNQTRPEIIHKVARSTTAVNANAAQHPVEV